MKRDMDLIRALLLKYEGEEDVDLSKYSEEQQVYHAALLVEAKLVKGEEHPGWDGETCNVLVERLTWEGHEFLDAARNETIWKKVKDKISSKGVDVGLSLLTALLISFTKDKLDMD